MLNTAVTTQVLEKYLDKWKYCHKVLFQIICKTTLFCVDLGLLIVMLLAKNAWGHSPGSTCGKPHKHPPNGS